MKTDRISLRARARGGLEKQESSTKKSVEVLELAADSPIEFRVRQGGRQVLFCFFHHQMADSSSSVNAKCSDGVSYFDSALKGKMTSHSSTANSSQASGGSGGPGGAATSGTQVTIVDRLKLLYPNVNETVDPLPRSWSPQDKCTTIGLTQNNLRVHYKGFYNLLSFTIDNLKTPLSNIIRY